MKKIFQLGTKDAFYTSGQVAIASLIGGPLAGSWLMGRNYQLFGEKGKAAWAIAYGIVSSVIALALGTIIFKDGFIVLFPFAFFPISAVVFYRLTKNIEQQKIIKEIVMGEKKQSSWCVVGTGILSLALTLCLFYFIFLMIPADFLRKHSGSCDTLSNGKQRCFTDIAQ